MKSSAKRFDVYAVVLTAAAVAVSCCIGCGSGGGPETAEVVGVVSYDGKPLTEGSAQFFPLNGKSAHGNIGADGKFSAAIPNGKGVPLGTCQIAVVVTKEGNPIPGERIKQVVWLIPQRFGSPATSGLAAEIQPGRNELKIDLSSKGTGSVSRVE